MPQNKRPRSENLRFRTAPLALAGLLWAGLPAPVTAGEAPRGEADGRLPSAVHEALANDLPGFSLIVLLHPLTEESRRRQRAAAAELRDILGGFRGGGGALLRPALFLPEARDLFVSRVDGGHTFQQLAASLALYQYLVPFFQRYRLDCNERVVIQLDAARRIGLAGAVYARSFNHAGLFFEQSGLVLDPFDGRFRSIGEFAVGRGYGRHDEGSYARTPSRHCLVRSDDAAAVCRDLRTEEQPHPVTANEPFASLLLDAAADSASRDPSHAQALAELALEIDPGNAEAHDTLAGLAAGPDAVAVAARHYRAALALDPHDAQIHYNFGTELQKRGDPAGAESEYREALRLEPRMLVAIENLGGLLLKRADRRDEGLDLLCRALAREQSEPRALRIRRLLAHVSAQPPDEAATASPRLCTPASGAVPHPAGAFRTEDRP